MNRTSIFAGILFFLVALVASAKPNVIVVDSEGKPIKGASVEPITLSMNLASKLTDKDGKVQIPKGAIQKTEWISVTKAGYVSSGHIKFDQPKPIKVTLKLEPKKPENKPVVDNRLPSRVEMTLLTTTLNPVAEWRSR